MTRKNHLLAIFLLIGINTYAQDWFSKYEKGTKIEGYIIGIAGDTLHGSIVYTYPIAMQKRIQFNKSGTGNPMVFTPDDVRGYGYDDMAWTSTMIRMNTYDGPYIFKRFGIIQSDPGPLGIYRVFEEPDKHIKRLNSEDAEKEFRKISLAQAEGNLDNLYIRKGDEAGELLSSKTFRKNFTERMRYYVGDFESLYTMLKNKERQLDDIFEIVNEYNRWFESRLMNH